MRYTGAIRSNEGTQQCYCTRFLPSLNGTDECVCSSCGAVFERYGAEW